MAAADDDRAVPIDSTADFERALARGASGPCVLRLYVAGSTPRSVRAIANLKSLCEKHLKGRFALEVIDIYLEPTLTNGDQIIAAPTLIKRLPPPLRRFVGDLSDMDRVLVGLDLRLPQAAEQVANGR
jgi:circadian clock protein KaiB